MNEDHLSDEDRPQVPSLPWGIKKRIIQEASPADTVYPGTDDEVSVTFVARIQNGPEIGASRDTKYPFRFVIDKKPREVVEGLELGVQTMRRHEIAEFTVAPRFAYDDMGSPPLVPPNATLVFEVELLDMMCKVDLFNNGKAVKTVLDRGTGSARPVEGQEVRVSLTVHDNKGSIVQQHADVDYVLAAADLHSMPVKIITQALLHMVEGERASVHLRRFAGCTLVPRQLQGAKMELYLAQIYEVSDVSFTQDGSLMKKVLRPADTDAVGTEEGQGVRLSVVSATDGCGEPINGFPGPTDLDFALGAGDVCDALELVAARMRVGERAALTCRTPSQCCEQRLGLTTDSAQKVVLVLELVKAAGRAVTKASPLPERLAFAAERREVGGALFKVQRYALSLQRYDWILALFEPSEVSAEVVELRRVCELNRALCFLKLGAAAKALVACNTVLITEPSNVKALYRRASAHYELSDYSAAAEDISKILAQEPNNGPARSLLTNVKAAQRHYNKEARSTAARMCGKKEPTVEEIAAASTPAKNNGGNMCLPLARVASHIFARRSVPCLRAA